MKTNQLIKHITSVVLIGFMLFTCMKMCIRDREVSQDWNSYTISADKGDIITLNYKCYVNSSDMNPGDENWIRLKGLEAKALTAVTLSLIHI